MRWLVVLGLIAAGPAGAGAFMEDPGASFLASSGTYRWNGAGAAQEVSVYATRGLKRLTLGADVNLTVGASGHALVFARLPVLRRVPKGVFAAEIGVGGAYSDGDWAPMVRLTLGHGRGWARGWYDVLATAEYQSGQPEIGWKLEGTLGLNGKARIQPMVQAGIGRGVNGVREWRVSAHLRLAGKNGRTWVLGVERKDAGTATTAITLALWRRF
ncbi:MAG: hypothetical protein KDK24_14950 [Pseudooceanicola sp.]|nr:hypothetical protein [Pseudooceanicola sp.]